ncbi:hypothetical protein D3C87_2006340 [compost metagenome]
MESLIRQIGANQNVAREELALGVDLAATTHFDNLLGRHENLLEQMLETLLLGLFLDRFSDLLFEIRIGVNNIPARSHTTLHPIKRQR